jgi:predicted  nucleic acid-binding Zn-ribbon protein
LDELDEFDDFDKKLEAALSGEMIEKDGVVDNDIIEQLLLEVEKTDLEGFDYFEYKKALKALDKMPMNEVTKYRSAFATASTIGVTLEDLLKSAAFYVAVLDTENEKTNVDFEKKITESVGKKETEVTQLKTKIQEKKALIKKLTGEITQHENKISDLKYKIKDSKKELTESQNNFKVTFDYLKSQFTIDIARMKEYLK